MHSGMMMPREEQHEQGRMERNRKYRIHGDAMLCSLDVPRMSAGDMTPKKIADMRERMDESTWDDRWCDRSVCEDAISALEASLAREDDLRRQVEERESPDMVTVPVEDLARNLSRIASEASGSVRRIYANDWLRRIERRTDLARALRSGDAAGGGGAA